MALHLLGEGLIILQTPFTLAVSAAVCGFQSALVTAALDRAISMTPCAREGVWLSGLRSLIGGNNCLAFEGSFLMATLSSQSTLLTDQLKAS